MQKVRLVSKSQAVLPEISNGEELTSFIARVSNPSNQMNHETAPKLLRYCLNHKHWSVFEHVYVTFEIATTRAIAAQILRHRSFCFQELSQRYSKVSEIIPYRARRQDIKNRQNSIDDMSEEDTYWFDDAQRRVADLSFELYEEALKRGVAKEQARMMLPLNTKTTLYMTGNLRSWLHYIELRASPATQLEHREIAIAIRDILSKEYPTIAEAAQWTQAELEVNEEKNK